MSSEYSFACELPSTIENKSKPCVKTLYVPQFREVGGGRFLHPLVFVSTVKPFVLACEPQALTSYHQTEHIE